MCSDELPQQNVYEVVYLPKEPLEFQASCLMRCGTRDDRDDYAWSLPESDLPQRFPGAAIFVAQVEWAWSPHNDRLDAYYICSNRRKTHWFLWIRSPDDNAWDFRMNSLLYAYCPRGKVDRKTAAIHLLLHAWRYEAAESKRDRFDWINDVGLITVSEVHAIERAVWGKLDSSVERPQLDSEKSNE
jgi:hypothetical protein